MIWSPHIRPGRPPIRPNLGGGHDDRRTQRHTCDNGPPFRLARAAGRVGSAARRHVPPVARALSPLAVSVTLGTPWARPFPSDVPIPAVGRTSLRRRFRRSGRHCPRRPHDALPTRLPSPAAHQSFSLHTLFRQSRRSSLAIPTVASFVVAALDPHPGRLLPVRAVGRGPSRRCRR